MSYLSQPDHEIQLRGYLVIANYMDYKFKGYSS